MRKLLSPEHKRFLAKLTIIAMLEGLLFGYDTGVISGARPPSSPVSRREPSSALLPPSANPSNRRWLRGCQGQARDVPDDAFRRRSTAIGWPVAAAEGPRPAASASKKLGCQHARRISPIGLETCSDVDRGAIQRLNKKGSSDGTFG